MEKKTDKRRFNGGAREGSGQKKLAEGEKKVTISFQIKQKYSAIAKKQIKMIVDEINSRND